MQGTIIYTSSGSVVTKVDAPGNILIKKRPQRENGKIVDKSGITFVFEAKELNDLCAGADDIRHGTGLIVGNTEQCFIFELYILSTKDGYILFDSLFEVEKYLDHNKNKDTSRSILESILLGTVIFGSMCFLRKVL